MPTESFKDLQSRFIGAIRDPQSFAETDPDTQRRMAIYQSLFFNNINGFLQNGFPVLHSLLDDDLWHQLVASFFQQHPCRSPYFAEISKEFVEYLSKEPEILKKLPDFASELAHYEWLELDVSIRKCQTPSIVEVPEPMPGSLQFSDLASLVSYRFPVHQISREYQPEAGDERFYYVVYRDTGDRVQFLQINAVTALLLQELSQSDQAVTSEQLLQAMFSALPGFSEAALKQGMETTLGQMLEKGIVLPA